MPPQKKTPTKNNNNWVKEALPRKRVSDCVFLQGLFFLHGHYSLQSYGDIFKNCRSLIVLYSTVIEWFQKQNLHCLFTCDFFWYPILKYYPICFVYKFHFLSSESTQIKQSDKKVTTQQQQRNNANPHCIIIHTGILIDHQKPKWTATQATFWFVYLCFIFMESKENKNVQLLKSVKVNAVVLDKQRRGKFPS